MPVNAPYNGMINLFDMFDNYNHIYKTFFNIDYSLLHL